MSNQSLVPAEFGSVSSRAVAAAQASGVRASDELGGGITTGFPVLSFRGKVWRVKIKGVEKVLMDRERKGEARTSVEMIIVKAPPHLSKIFYADGYTEGSNSPPDCFSVNGVVPDSGARNKQSNTCAGCPKNAWGSKVTAAGKKGKACADSKRLVITPLMDPTAESIGGPMLLRIPAASLGDLQLFAQQMEGAGFPYYAIGVRIGFDFEAEYPKLLFSGIRALSDDEVESVLALRDDPRTARILSEASEMAQTNGVDETNATVPDLPDTNAGLFEQPGQQPAAAVAGTGKAQGAPSQPRQAAPQAQAAPRTAPAPKPAQQAPQAAPDLDDILEGAPEAPPHDPETGEIEDAEIVEEQPAPPPPPAAKPKPAAKPQSRVQAAAAQLDQQAKAPAPAPKPAPAPAPQASAPQASELPDEFSEMLDGLI